MKKITYILLLTAITIASLTCKKTPEIPTGGNKIEIGETSIDSVAYYIANVSTIITATGGNEIAQHGHCWGIEKAPTIEDNKTTLGKLTKPDTVFSELTRLENNSVYNIRAYITYKNGTLYGIEENIKTIETRKPVVSTNDVTNITINSATCGGINDDGGFTINQRGVCWNTTGNPTLENSIGLTNDGDGTGSFISEITNLNEGIKYYATAYATNEKGTSYGEVKQFETVPIILPTVTTTEITEITTTSVTISGSVISNGNSTVTARGVCWNITGNPILENNLGITTDGSGTGSFTSEITGLNEGVTYYATAYATNEKGTSYGIVVQFATFTLSLPSVTTTEITEITTTSATSGGNITSNGNGTVTARGVCWNTIGNPTLENNIGHATVGNGTGSFTSNITGLIDETIYYTTAYAINEKGTAYGNEVSFETLDDPCDGLITIIYEGQTYNTVVIFDQCWMKENLNFEIGNSSCYDDDPSNCIIYGRLYDWETIMNGETSSNSVPSGVQGICPSGWHLPSGDEWKILEGNTDTQYGVGDSEWDGTGYRGYDAGKRLKTTTGWSSNTGTDAVGFSALPGGFRNTFGDFSFLVGNGNWWSATADGSTNAWSTLLLYDKDEVGRNSVSKGFGFSVRCIRN